MASGSAFSEATESTKIDLLGLLKHTRTPLFLASATGDLLYANEATVALLESTRGTVNAFTNSLFFFTPPQDLPGNTIRRTQRCLPTATGNRWFDVLFLALRDHVGEHLAFWGIVQPPEDTSPIPVARDSIVPARLALLRQQQREAQPASLLYARSPRMRRVVQQLQWAVTSLQPVALLGEMGTGKRTVAQWIHQQTLSDKGLLVVLDCYALPAQAQHEQLLGRVDLPDAHSPQALGVLAWKQSFSLLLHGVSELSLELQKEIVKAFTPEVSKSSESALVSLSERRLLVSERGSLETARTAGKLSEELYYLASPLVIELPPLRQRREEIGDYAQALAEELGQREKLPRAALTPAAVAILAKYDWPGNFYELQAVLLQALKQSQSGVLTPRDFPKRLGRSGPTGPSSPKEEQSPPPLDEVLEQVEKRLLTLALSNFRGNKSKAAEFLGISRARLHRRVEQWRLTEPESDKPVAAAAPESLPQIVEQPPLEDDDLTIPPGSGQK